MQSSEVSLRWPHAVHNRTPETHLARSVSDFAPASPPALDYNQRESRSRPEFHFIIYHFNKSTSAPCRGMRVLGSPAFNNVCGAKLILRDSSLWIRNLALKSGPWTVITCRAASRWHMFLTGRLPPNYREGCLKNLGDAGDEREPSSKFWSCHLFKHSCDYFTLFLSVHTPRGT